jgi:pyrimidine operon attenuation protein/uracil phosphoribosyltransferase
MSKTESNLLNYNNYTKIKSLNVNSIYEGVNYKCSHDLNGKLLNGKIDIDWNNDSENDVIKLNPVRPVKSSRISTIETYVGYALEDLPSPGDNFLVKKPHRIKRCFSEFAKEWESISDKDLKNLIDYTYPDALREKSTNVAILFVMGSSAPLASRIAEALKEMYYKSAKIIDITKAYYGADVRDIIDWKKYDRSDARTQAMINSYIRGFQTSWDPDGKKINPRRKWEGYIKKSSGLQAGARSLLKPGHVVDEYIIDTIRKEMIKHKEIVKTGDMRIAKATSPMFLAVDDLIIGGSTMRGAFDMLLNAISNPSNNIENPGIISRGSRGYALFSYSDKSFRS